MPSLKLTSRSLFYFLSLAILCISSQSLFAQTQPEACRTLPPLKDFSVIDEIRGRLQKEISESQARIKEIKDDRIPKTTRAETDLKAANDKIKELTDKPNKTEADQKQLEQWNSVKTSIEDYMSGRTVAFYQEELQKLENALPFKEEQLRCVNAELSRLLSPEQEFKKTMSIIFAILIGMVILGFFVLAFQDPNIRRAIFAGQAGLQFLTLFSIVIAIILFGITNILHDKELAALLGGLSGYILGRYNAPRRGSESSDNEGGGDSGEGSRQNLASRLASITISPASVSLSSASPSQQLTAILMDARGKTISDTQETFTLKWRSDDESVATVSQSGVVTYIGAGTCNVTATFNNVSSNNCAVTCAT